MELSDDFKNVLQKHGGVNESAPLNAEELERIPDYLPDDLKAFYNIYGRAIFRQGRMCVCHPDDLAGVLELIFDGDPDIKPEDCVAFAYNAFDEIYVWNKNFATVDVSLSNGWVRASVLTKPPKIRKYLHRRIATRSDQDNEAYDMWGDDDKRLFSRCRKKYGQLDTGQCYGFFPALGLGGPISLDHIKRTEAAPYWVPLHKGT